jgi:CBS-domain-containing membrane protein
VASSPLANYTGRAKLVPTFEDKECHVVSVTDPYGRILGLLVIQ